MNTSETSHSHPRTARMVRARRLLAAGALVPLLAVAACSSDSPPSSPGDGTSPGSTAATGSPGATDTPETPVPERTNKPVKAEIRDPELGHGVNVTMVTRNRPWPADQQIAQDAYELVAVQLVVRAGSRYSAQITPQMFRLQGTGPTHIPPTTEFGPELGTPLPTVERGEVERGYLFFKVERGQGHPLTLWLHRPAYKVSTTGQSFPAKKFGVKIDD